MDVTLGATLGFSTLTAAGVGLAVAQGCGVKLRARFLRFFEQIWKEPLAPSQKRLYHVREISKFCKVIGVILGCLVPLLPFLLIPNKPRMFEKLVDFLPPSKKEELLAAMPVVVFENGTQIIKAGEPSQYLYLITCGEVEIFGNKNEEPAFLGTLHHGHIFGEIGFLLGDPSEIDVFASTDLRAKRLSRRVFFDVLGEDGQKFLQKVADTNMTRPGELNQSLKHEFTSEPPKPPRKSSSYLSLVERAASKIVQPSATLPTAD